jgi:hypothetical protein
MAVLEEQEVELLMPVRGVVVVEMATRAAAADIFHSLIPAGREERGLFVLFGPDHQALLAHTLQQIQATCNGTLYSN